MELTRPRRSYSRLDTWQQCPAAYKAKYVDKVPEEPSVWSAGGTAFHTVAEQYLRGELSPTPSERDVWKAWLEAWYTAIDEMGTDLPITQWRAANRGSENAAWWEEHGYAMVRRFIRWKQTTGAGLQVLDVDGQPGLEQQMEVELAGIPVIAIPDWLAVDEHGQVCIVDYKTGKPPKTPKQQRFYAAVLAEKHGLHAPWGLFYMARPGQLIAHDLTRSDPAELIAQLVEFDERERAGDYDLRPGQECLAYQCPTHTRRRR